jgi:hypothetical protein
MLYTKMLQMYEGNSISKLQMYEGNSISKLQMYEGNSVSKLQIQVATYVFFFFFGNCHL